jgi:GxxExxY protein
MEFDELSRSVIGCAEIKSVEALLPIHQAQILTYMRLANVPLGSLISFNVTRLQSGIKRFVL